MVYSWYRHAVTFHTKTYIVSRYKHIYTYIYIYTYRQTFNISGILVARRTIKYWSLRCSWPCSNYDFILDLTPGFNGLDKNNCNTKREHFKIWKLVLLYWRFDGSYQYSNTSSPCWRISKVLKFENAYAHLYIHMIYKLIMNTSISMHRKVF